MNITPPQTKHQKLKIMPIPTHKILTSNSEKLMTIDIHRLTLHCEHNLTTFYYKMLSADPAIGILHYNAVIFVGPPNLTLIFICTIHIGSSR